MRPPLVELGIEQERALIGELKASGFAMPGLAGSVVLKLLPYLPFLGKRFNLSEFNFLKMGNLYASRGHELDLMHLLEGLLAHYQRNIGMLLLDKRSPIYQQMRSVGKFNFLGASLDSEVQVMAAFEGWAQDEIDEVCSRPLHISMNDI